MIFDFWPGPSRWPAFGHLWTLSVEQQFYVVFPLLLMVLAPRRRLMVFLGLAALGPLVRYGYCLAVGDTSDDPLWRAFAVYASSICQFDAFLLGAGLRLLQERGWVTRQLSNLAWAIGLTAFAAYACFYIGANRAGGAVGVDLIRNVISGIMSGDGREYWIYTVIDLLVFATLLHLLLNRAGTGVLASRWAVAVGRVSYGGYLFHALILQLIGMLFVNIADLSVLPRIGLFIAVFLMTVLLANVSYDRFERPVARWLTKLRQGGVRNIAAGA